MKFEQLLQVYWLKGFLFGGETILFENTFDKVIPLFKGLFQYSLLNFIKKFEFTYKYKQKMSFLNFSADDLKMSNIYFSQVTSVNHSLNEGLRLASVRLYMSKLYKGRCQALGKPSRGQRTRSNGKSAKKNPNNTKLLVAEFKKTHIKIEPSKVINYKIKDWKPISTKITYKKKPQKKLANLWF